MSPVGTPQKTPSTSKNRRSRALGPRRDGKSIHKDEVSIFHAPSVSSTPSSISRKKPGNRINKLRLLAREKAWHKKMDTLSKFLKLIPFSPGNTLDLTAHESLLRNLELWDFAHIDFDTHIREDLVKELMAHYTKDTRLSIVKGFRIQVNCAGLSRAMKLPRHKKSSPAKEIELTKDEISFLEKFVSKWFLLHGEMWIMPEEILHCMNLVKEGKIGQIDWAKILWIMMEKELHSIFDLHQCFYASHFQHLIKYEKPDLIEENPDKNPSINIGDHEDLVVEESQPTTQVPNSSSSDAFPVEEVIINHTDEVELKEENSLFDENKNNIAIEDTTMDIEIEAEIPHVGDAEKSGKLIEGIEGNTEMMECKNDMLDTSVLGRCKHAEASQNEDEMKYHEATEMDGLIMEELVVEDEQEEEDQIDEEDNEEGDVGLSILSQRQHFEGVCTGFPSGLHIPEGNFLASGVDSHRYPHEQRSEGMWEENAASEMDVWIDQMNQMMQKCKAMYSSKKQACHEMSMNQQLYLAELQQRDNVIQRLKEELHAKHMEAYRLENEVYMMSNLVEGYRKALKRVQRSFAEFREKYPLAKESVYEDTGCGGLVLSKMELERQRLRKEEEERQTLLVLEAQIKLFESEFVSMFKHYDDQLEMLNKKLGSVEDSWHLVKYPLDTCHVPPSNVED